MPINPVSRPEKFLPLLMDPPMPSTFLSLHISNTARLRAYHPRIIPPHRFRIASRTIASMLRYPAPADRSDWESALPIGNGRLGAMVYGGVPIETLRLNEESVWYGGPQSRTPQPAAYLPRLRELIREKKHAEAESLVKKRFFATPRSARHYEPLGQCYLDFEHGEEELTGYERCLDIEKAEATVMYTVGGNEVRRSCIASFPDGVIAVHIQAEEPVTFTVALTRMSDKWYETNEFLDSVTVRDGMIVIHATPGGANSNHLCAVAGGRCWDENGTFKVVGRSLQVTSKDAILVIGAHTTYRHDDPEEAAISDVISALQKPPGELWKRHHRDWNSLYGRQELRMWPNNHNMYTNERLKSAPDPGLIALYHNYGRYLLLSSSRDTAKALPSTLQGIWNSCFSPPWGSKYTININLQMNYWPVNTGNLAECAMPLFNLLHRLAQNGVKTAKAMYGCRGWCCHHNTDIWADTDPQDTWMPATLWPLGGAWLCTHIWEHYLFDENVKFLASMFPVLQGCVEFLLDFLVADETGKYLVTIPSLSPENTYCDEMGAKAVFCEGSTVDMEIVRTVFRDFLSAIEQLQGKKNDSSLSTTTAELRAQVQTALPRLPPIKVSPATNTIQEWGLQDRTEAEPGHRHVSHLIGLYPGSSITPSSTSHLAAAALITLERRLANGGGHTGWSRAWLIGLFARLRKPQQCYENIVALLRDSTVPNMMDSHPPVQLDGNWGGCAGILECLVQSHEIVDVEGKSVRLIRLLPACPVEWGSGVLSGAKARGGFEVDFEWEDGKVKRPVVLRSALGNEVMVCVHGCGDGSEVEGKMVLVEGEKGRHEVWCK